MSDAPQDFQTLAIHAGAQPDPATGARQVPIYQTTAYVFRDADHAAALFNLADDVGEKKNVAAEHPEVSKKLAAQLDKFIKDGRSRPAKEKPVKKKHSRKGKKSISR